MALANAGVAGAFGFFGAVAIRSAYWPWGIAAGTVLFLVSLRVMTQHCIRRLRRQGSQKQQAKLQSPLHDAIRP